MYAFYFLMILAVVAWFVNFSPHFEEIGREFTQFMKKFDDDNDENN